MTDFVRPLPGARPAHDATREPRSTPAPGSAPAAGQRGATLPAPGSRGTSMPGSSRTTLPTVLARAGTPALEAWRAVPARALILLGLSGGAYALTLAGVTGLQSASEAALSAQRDPMAAGIQRLAREHDALAAGLAESRRAYAAAVAAYEATGTGISAMESALGDLAAAVSDLSGTAAALPATVPVPTVTRNVAKAAPSPVQATTGASGG